MNNSTVQTLLGVAVLAAVGLAAAIALIVSRVPRLRAVSNPEDR